jgi:predicted metal-dependent hydrolase
MTLIERRIPDGSDELVVTARYDSRLKKTVRWTVSGGEVTIRVPPHLRPRDLEHIVDEIVEKVRKQRARARQQLDTDLQARARALNRRYFGGELAWHTIRWVDNMEKRLGSCTTGGTTDGDIRLSARLRSWPGYVVDYVLAHELVHRKHPNHSKEFWEYLSRYPEAERARGFIEGIAFAENRSADDLL